MTTNQHKYQVIPSETSSIIKSEIDYQSLNTQSIENSHHRSNQEGRDIFDLLNNGNKHRGVEVTDFYRSELPKENNLQHSKQFSNSSKKSEKEESILLKNKVQVNNQVSSSDESNSNSNNISNNVNDQSNSSKIFLSPQQNKKNSIITEANGSGKVENLNISETQSILSEESPSASPSASPSRSYTKNSILNNSSISHNRPSSRSGSMFKLKDIMNDDVLKSLMMKEQEKIKLSKRRQTILNRRKSESDKKTKEAVNSNAFLNMVQKEEIKTPYGRNRLFIKWIDCLISILVCVNIATSIIDNEIYMKYSDQYLQNITSTMNQTESKSTKTMSLIENREITPEENFLRFINLIVVITICTCISLHYYLKIKLLQADRKLSEYDNIFTSGLFKYLFMELFICAFFYPPYMNYVISGVMLGSEFVYNMNALISFVVTLKSYIILRVYSYFSRWTSDAANSICMKYRVRAGVHFAIKAELKKRPYTMLTILMLISLTICAFAVRTFEYGVLNGNNSTISLKGGNDLQSLDNCFWLIIITMTTVGYGDIVTKSHFGRFISVVACILGMLLVSLIVVSLAVISEFTNEEKKAYLIIKKLQAEDSANNKAADVIKDLIKLRFFSIKGVSGFKLLKKKINNKIKISNLTARFVILTQLKRSISLFKNDFKIANSFSLPLDEMLKRLETKLKEDIASLSSNINKISLVDDHLDSLANMQDLVQEKMTVILKRQKKIADYIVKINNENYKNAMRKLSNETRKKSFFPDSRKHMTLKKLESNGAALHSHSFHNSQNLEKNMSESDQVIKEHHKELEESNVSFSDRKSVVEISSRNLNENFDHSNSSIVES
jgi:hypothetical protein